MPQLFEAGKIKLPEELRWITRFRTALFLVLVHSFLPMLILVVIISGFHRMEVESRINNDIDYLLQATVNQFEQQINTTRTLTQTLAELDVIRTFDAEKCKPFLTRLIDNDNYTNLSVVDLKGDIVCTVLSSPDNIPINAADREYFQKVIETQDFVVSNLVTGRFVGRSVVLAAEPIFDSNNELTGAVVVGMDLNWMSNVLAEAHTPEGSVLMVLDHADNVVARWPNPEEFVGKSMSDNEMVKATHSLRQRRTEVIGTGLDGVERQYEHTHIRAANDHLHLYVGIPSSYITEQSNKTLYQSIGLTLLTSIAMIALVAIDWRIITTATRLSHDKKTINN